MSGRFSDAVEGILFVVTFVPGCGPLTLVINSHTHTHTHTAAGQHCHKPAPHSPAKTVTAATAATATGNKPSPFHWGVNAPSQRHRWSHRPNIGSRKAETHSAAARLVTACTQVSAEREGAGCKWRVPTMHPSPLPHYEGRPQPHD